MKPTQNSQNALILAHLQSKRTLTPAGALDKFGCFRLAARIHQLRERGYPIKSRRHPAGFSIYSMG